MNIVEVKGMSKSYGDTKVLDSINFEIKKGTFTALLGKNGSGKSTILNLMMGNEQLDAGECLILGQSIKKNPVHLKNLVGHVSEKLRLDDQLVIKDFIPEYAKFFDGFSVDKFFALANKANINTKKEFGAYSRGQKMQILLMAALSQKSELLLVDEITSVLDASARNFFVTILKEYTQAGGTVILTTNIVNEVQFFCTDVIFLSDSHIKFQTKLEDIPSRFRKVRTMVKDHKLLKDSKAIWSGHNSDGTDSFLVSSEVLNILPADIQEDKRLVTLEDLYIYHSQRGADE